MLATSGYNTVVRIPALGIVADRSGYAIRMDTPHANGISLALTPESMTDEA